MNIYSNERVSGFLHTDGRKMRNGNGDEILLCGWGAGNWNNPEGFLCGDQPGDWSVSEPYKVPERFDRARTMESSIRLLCGSKYAAEFWPKWYRNHLGEADIRAMAAYGYNSVRLPLNARAFLAEEPEINWNEDNFQMLTNILDWCETYRLYAIIDMHTTPGGQSGIKCDDGLEFFPRFFLEEESMERTSLLWEEIATRYKDRWIIGAYDLLNEPLASADTLHLLPQLSAFYDHLIARIRAIDQKHMLTIEGAQAATNNQIFDHNFDPQWNNWCIHIHYYGFSPERRSLFRFLEPSIRLNVPIWMGEGPYQHNAVLMEVAYNLGIGFNLWSWKTATLPNGTLRRDPVQYNLPIHWQKIIDCLHNGTPRPTYKECQAIFDEMLENIKFEHCILLSEQHTYILRRPGRTLPAAAYDSDPASFYGTWDCGNVFDYRTEDRIKLILKEGCAAPLRPMPFDSMTSFPIAKPLENLILELHANEYVTYSIYDVQKNCPVYLSLRATTASSVQISDDDTDTGYMFQLAGHDTFREIETLCLPPNEHHHIQIKVLSGCIQVEHITFR